MKCKNFKRRYKQEFRTALIFFFCSVSIICVKMYALIVFQDGVTVVIQYTLVQHFQFIRFNIYFPRAGFPIKIETMDCLFYAHGDPCRVVLFTNF